MGCDIHAYIEYKHKGYNNWDSFGGAIHMGRNYEMFGILAKGVRCDMSNAFPTKGLPLDMGYEALADSRLYICNDGGKYGEGETTIELALKWEKNHGCKIQYSNDKPKWVDNPDWHSHIWLSLEEFRKAIGIYISNTETSIDYIIEFRAALAAMESLASNADVSARIVLWFDN